jgi:hypothetical protein
MENVSVQITCAGNKFQSNLVYQTLKMRLKPIPLPNALIYSVL